MNKTTIAVCAAALASFTAAAQDLPVPAALPAPAPLPGAPIAQNVEEFETGALCKTYHSQGFFNSTAERLREYLESATEVDMGYDASASKFDGKKVALPGHEYNTVTWVGRFNSPIEEEYKFIVTGAYGCPFVFTVNGKTIQGRGQQTLKVKMTKGIDNTVYIASGSENPITIQYTLAKYAKAPTYTLVPSNLKHVVEEDVPVFKLD